MSTSRVRSGVLAVIVGLIGALAGAAPTAAGSLPGPDDDPQTGRHALIDTFEYPGAECVEELTVLDRIKVRRPVMFARDRTSGTDSQVVGWRWQLRNAAFALLDQGPMEKATGTDLRAAEFAPKTIDMSGRPDIQYFVSIRMVWYVPGSSTQVQAVAVHYVRLYLSNGAVGQSGCSGIFVVHPTPPGHTGDYGVHLLLDNEHLVPVLCDYASDDGALERVRATGPIALAFNSGPGVQSQDVSWRFRVEFTDVASPDKFTVWTTLPAGMSFLKTNATERRPAGFGTRSRNLTPSEQGHVHYRVQVVIRWHRPNGTVDGQVTELVANYGMVGQGFQVGSCDGDVVV